MIDVKANLLAGLTENQVRAVKNSAQRMLVVAGAGSGKTEVMARRVAWWVAVERVPKSAIIAFTFTDRAAEEMKFRIRAWMQRVTPSGEDATLGDMYIGTIHGFCLKLLRDLSPDKYANFDILDEGARIALIQRGYNSVLGLRALEAALRDANPKGYASKFGTIDTFIDGYDFLHEYDEFEVTLPDLPPPRGFTAEAEWCKQCTLGVDVGRSGIAQAFGMAAARYYAYLHSRRFLDFSTSQSELVRLLRGDRKLLAATLSRITHIVVDEVQDINPVQAHLIKLLRGRSGRLTAVGDHRQAIFAWRGGRVEVMADLHEELRAGHGTAVVDLTDNFRSTPRIIELANRWADTIGAVQSMTTPQMRHGRKQRLDYDPSHVAALRFPDREAEAAWIADRTARLVDQKLNRGAKHDTPEGSRGISLSEIAVLVRSSTDARTYMTALEARGVPAVFRAGPDLFSQPEVLLLLAVMSRLAGVNDFFGSNQRPNSLPGRIAATLDGCPPNAADVIRAACRVLRVGGLPMESGVEERLLLATDLLRRKMAGEAISAPEAKRLRNPYLTKALLTPGQPRRVFPQRLYHYALGEAGVEAWEGAPRGQTAMFHLGQLSSLIKGLETPGWTDPKDLQYQMIALAQWGTRNAKSAEAPLLVQPDAVTISTIHAAKGLEFAAVFLADVCVQRFPSNYARREPALPYDGAILERIDPAQIADNANTDSERRLMYVALTRAERYLFVTASSERTSPFFRDVERLVGDVGGRAGAATAAVPSGIKLKPTDYKRDLSLATSFSDVRYYLECPHDFYLRKVLGFAPTIDQAFGYGRGVHNLMRAIHSDPKRWAAMARNPSEMAAELQRLMDSGLFYLRYTTGAPLEQMRAKALQIIGEYVMYYSSELARLTFEPEREFETYIEEEKVLLSGAIDVVRLDDPPRVTLIDFKSGDPESDLANRLHEDEMRLQVGLYGLAARHELEYEPERGLVRYLGTDSNGERKELCVDLDDAALAKARGTLVEAARDIRQRKFKQGPRRQARDPKNRGKSRCIECDFGEFCGMVEARQFRAARK